MNMFDAGACSRNTSATRPVPQPASSIRRGGAFYLIICILDGRKRRGDKYAFTRLWTTMELEATKFRRKFQVLSGRRRCCICAYQVLVPAPPYALACYVSFYDPKIKNQQFQ